MTDYSQNLSLRIEKTLSHCQEILGEGNSYPKVRSALEDAQRKLHTPMQVAIIGRISSSKSTLVNTLLSAPGLVKTGQMEETFNVSWIKYGPRDGDIRVIFKDNHVEVVPVSEWEHWSSHQSNNRLKETVKYIERYYDNEILKSLNIIDTPGLDALSALDSQNTIDFLKEVHPDAVIVLFTKSLTDSIVQILRDFQGYSAHNDFSLTPLNAIGAMAKSDTMWNILSPDSDVLVTGNRVISNTLYKKYPEVRESFFDIYPISALLGLASKDISSKEIQLLRAYIDNNCELLSLLSDPDSFLNEDCDGKISIEERKLLYERFGLYGLHLMLSAIANNSTLSSSELSALLYEKSGLIPLVQSIESHFRDRAVLIKSQNTIVSILDACKIELESISNPSIEAIQRVITSELLDLHEFEEWNWLSKIYGGKLSVDSSIAEEFKRISGEFGNSLVEKLGISKAESVETMLNYMKERALALQAQYNIYSIIEPSLSGLFKCMVDTYAYLIKKASAFYEDYMKAKSIVAEAEQFIYGGIVV